MHVLHVCSVEELGDRCIGVGLGVSVGQVKPIVEVGTCARVWSVVVEIGAITFPVCLCDTIYRSCQHEPKSLQARATNLI